jgi:hypothetical protein
MTGSEDLTASRRAATADAEAIRHHGGTACGDKLWRSALEAIDRDAPYLVESNYRHQALLIA